MRWTKAGILYERDKRHSEIVVREMGFEGAKAAPTAGTSEEQIGASVIVAALRVEIEDESPELNARDAQAFEDVAARCNHLAQGNVDMQYASKEASRTIAKPRQSDWALLKRLGRHHLSAPRLVQLFPWQDLPKSVDVFADSD